MTELSLSQLESELEAERAIRISLAKELFEHKERLRLFTIASDDPTWDWDLVTGHVHRNHAAVALIGENSPIDDATIEWWQRHIHPEDKARVMDLYLAAFAGQQTTFAADYRLNKAGQTYAHLLDRGFIIRDENQIAVRAIGISVDLTAFVVAREQLAQAQTALVHAARFSAMGTMASMITHEINQPLAAITNYIQAARRIAAAPEATAPSSVEHALQAAEESALHAGGIVRRLRELVRRGHVERRPATVRSLIDDACTIALIDAEMLLIRSDVDIAQGTSEVAVDAIQIQQVLINLVRNSVEAFGQIDDRHITISAHKAGSFVEVSVADNGPGIAPDIAQDLFGVRASPKASGMGIGLSICRTIVEAHGGKIWLAESEVGADFRFTLPVAGDLTQSLESTNAI